MNRDSMIALVDKFDADLLALGNNIAAGIKSIQLDLANFRAAVNALPAQALTEADLVAIAERLRPTLLAAAESVLGIAPADPAPAVDPRAGLATASAAPVVVVMPPVTASEASTLTPAPAAVVDPSRFGQAATSPALAVEAPAFVRPSIEEWQAAGYGKELTGDALSEAYKNFFDAHEADLAGKTPAADPVSGELSPSA